ncbi:hypothetical protein Hanom_Chr16g01453291 [Helianthus anomalus]
MEWKSIVVTMAWPRPKTSHRSGKLEKETSSTVSKTTSSSSSSSSSSIMELLPFEEEYNGIRRCVVERTG